MSRIIEDQVVSYEDFGAGGDGVSDDLPAICAAHEHANANGLPVKTKGDAIYHLGRQALTVVIKTDTDWNTSRFTIDDREVDDHRQCLFSVESDLDPLDLKIDRLSKDQTHLDFTLESDCYVYVENEQQRKFIRKGLNVNKGNPQHDCFVLCRDGSISSLIDWEYDEITRIEVRPIDETPLRLKGGIFTTFANDMRQEVGYNYWSRNIKITRSNTEVDGVTHYVVGETQTGHPYGGFVSASRCANFTIRNSFFTGHKMYKTIGAAGEPVSMGSYDITANNIVNLRLVNCKMNHILDRSHWGVICTNFCKDILLEDCTLSRMDTHMGVSGTYTIRRCTLGHMGLNAIGRGLLLMEDSTIYKHALVNLRGDYGSTWEGEIQIKNCRWIPNCGEPTEPKMIDLENDGAHDFGYPCFMPEKVSVDGLTVDDRNHPESYEGLLFFADPDGGDCATPPKDRPFPYQQCKELKVRGLVTMSGKAPRISTNPALAYSIAYTTED